MRGLPAVARRAAHRAAGAAQLTARVAPFWAKTPFYRWTPGGFGYYRRLRRYADPTLDDLRNRHPVRRKHFGSSGLRRPDETGLVRRDYESYEEYLVHQRQKLDVMIKSGHGFPNAVVAEYRRRFYRRFRHLLWLLPRDATIVCLGARQGTEVEVMRDLGFRNAHGIDLNPGPENPLVRPGDFHHLENEDASVDLVYTNSVDHAFDLDDFFREHTRVLKPQGYALYDIHGAYHSGDPAPFEATLWNRSEDVVARALRYYERIVKLETDGDWTWVLFQQPRAPAR